MGIKPEDILSDDKNTTERNGLTLRKGTVAAALANVEIIESHSATKTEKAGAIAVIKELAPALIALGLSKHLNWKNPVIQKIMDDCQFTSQNTSTP